MKLPSEQPRQPKGLSWTEASKFQAVARAVGAILFDRDLTGHNQVKPLEGIFFTEDFCVLRELNLLGHRCHRGQIAHPQISKQVNLAKVLDARGESH